MAYSIEAKRLRRCTSLTKFGLPCRSFACWDDPLGRCMSHAGRHHCGPRNRKTPLTMVQRTRYRPCTCPAYRFPHRPGGGGCNWPGAPKYLLLTPAGTRRKW